MEIRLLNQTKTMHFMQGCMRRLQMTQMEWMVASCVSSCVVVCNRSFIEASYEYQILSATEITTANNHPLSSWTNSTSVLKHRYVFTHDAKESNRWFFDFLAHLNTLWFPTFGCFQKQWYPQIIHFNRVFHYKPSILGVNTPIFGLTPILFGTPRNSMVREDGHGRTTQWIHSNCPETSGKKPEEDNMSLGMFKHTYLGVNPKIGGKPPKWMVYNGKPY